MFLCRSSLPTGNGEKRGLWLIIGTAVVDVLAPQHAMIPEVIIKIAGINRH